jgi:DnaD/phage-associated family protein
MATIRVEKSTGYSVINNTGLNDANLSFKAKGILAYLLSKPDNWKCLVGDLSNNARDGRDSIYGGLQELRKYGYMIKRPIRNNQGKVIEWEEVIYETPTEEAKIVYEEQLKRRKLKKQEKKNPLPENPDMDKTIYGFPVNGSSVNGKPVNIISTDVLNTNIPNTDYKKKETITLSMINKTLITTYKECISKSISKQEKLILFDLQSNVDIKVINKAIILAALNNVKKINYIKTTLEDWLTKGLTTIDAVDLHLAKWINENKKAKERREKKVENAAKEKEFIPKTNFNSYDQRSYDYDELEKKLLGWN